MQGVVELKRRDRTLPGEPEVHFSVLRPEPGVMAEGRVQWVTPHTPDTVWRPETISQNGVEGLTDILLCVDDPAAVAARYGRYLGRAPVARAGMQVIALDRGGVVFADPGTLAKRLPGFRAPSLPFMAGQALRADLSVTRDVIAKAGVTPAFATDELICLGPSDALGGYMLFHAPDVAHPWDALRLNDESPARRPGFHQNSAARLLAAQRVLQAADGVLHLAGDLIAPCLRLRAWRRPSPCRRLPSPCLWPARASL